MKEKARRHGTQDAPFKPTVMKGGARPATTSLVPRGGASRFGTRRRRGDMAVAAASLLAAEPPSSTESSGDKAGRAAYQLRQPILSEVGFRQQQQQEQQQQEEQEEEEAIDSLDFAGGSDDDAKANMENEAQNMDFDEVEVSEQEAGKTALEAKRVLSRRWWCGRRSDRAWREGAGCGTKGTPADRQGHIKALQNRLGSDDDFWELAVHEVCDPCCWARLSAAPVQVQRRRAPQVGLRSVGG